MSRPLAVTEQEADYTISPSTDVRSLIQSERDLYPSLFYDINDPFHPEIGEDNKVDANSKSEEIAIDPLMEANVGESLGAPHYYDSNNFGDFDFTTLPAPPISHSNPETPTEPDFSFDGQPPDMARVLSEQSSLARMPRYQKSELEARSMNQGHNQVHNQVQNQVQSQVQSQLFPSPAITAPKSLSGTPTPRSRVGSISGVASPGPRPQQNPNQGNLYERLSHARQHIGPSGLRNSISAPSGEYDRPPSSSSQQYSQPVQANIGTPLLGDQFQSHGTQYQHDFGSQSPQLWPQDQHASPYKTRMNTQRKFGPMSNFTSHDHFADLYNSPHDIHPSSFGEDRSHRIMTQENVNPPQYNNELLLGQGFQPENQYLPQQRRVSGIDHGNLQHMNMKPADYPSEARQSRLKYQSLEDARREKSVSTHNPLVDHTVPQSPADDCHYVERMLEAMLDMSMAEDNAGMKRTWESMKRDIDKVEKAAWEILNLCKERHRRNGPFEMSPKILRQYDSFQDRVQTICEAMQTQKTLCKHLLRQPFNEEVVEDPIAAVSRIKNNRKVNHGKKEAIDKGREALGETGHGKGRRTTKVAQEDTDEEFDGEDDEYGSQVGAQVHASKKRSLSHSHGPVSRRRQASSDDPLDQSYLEGSAPKKNRRASRSVYQLDERNQMVDTSQQHLKTEHGTTQQSFEHLDVGSNIPYGFHNMSGARQGDPLFSSGAEVDFGQHQQAQAEGRRRVGHR